MSAKPARLFWARGSLLGALCGHWIANAAFDRGQYVDAGLDYTWRASLPILVQSAIVLLLVALLGPLSRRWTRPDGTASPRRHAMPSTRLILLVTSQLSLFMLLELSERAVQREPFGDGLFASGFVFELLFAIGSALLLLVLGSAAVRAIRSIRREPRAAPVDRSVVPAPVSVPVARPLISAGHVRAPPPLQA